MLFPINVFCSGHEITNEMPTVSKYKVATIQYQSIRNKKEQNTNELLALCKEAAENGAKVIVTPELGITGYPWLNRKEVSSEVETVPGPTTSLFSKLSKNESVYIVFSLPEVDSKTNLYYNTAVLVGPEGYVGKYRKTHSWVCEP